MKLNRKLIFKVALYSLVVFTLLFCFRLYYGYTLKFEDTTYRSQFFNNVSQLKKNYASKEYKMKGGGSTAPTRVDQKYEKVAQVESKSTRFDKEESLVRSHIKSNNAIIQFEQKKGNTGYRNLHLLIGVPPKNFDTLYTQLTQIGIVLSKQITKKDKTNEYKELNARKSSLEKTLFSLIELKNKGGKIDEYMALENRILDIQQQLQDLGVNLGDFDEENEFCTVKFSIQEGKEITISTIHRVKVALEWSVKTFLKIITSLFFLLLTTYIVTLIVTKVKSLKIFNK